jgi:hypothetical protein
LTLDAMLLHPGAAEAAFRLDARQMPNCLNGLGDRFSIPAVPRCLGPDGTAGAVRAASGPANNRRDIRRALDVIASFAA